MANLIFKTTPNLMALRAMALLVFLFAFTGIALSQASESFSINESPLPPPTGYVNDYVGVIDPATKQELETKLKTLKETSDPSVEIAVAVIKTTGGRDISDYALAIYRGWKIGTKEADNPGALLLVAVDDRKYFTEVGRDLEDELPDGLVGSLHASIWCLNLNRVITAKASPTPSTPTFKRSRTREMARSVRRPRRVNRAPRGTREVQACSAVRSSASSFF